MIDIATILKGHEKINLEVKAASGGIPNSLWETYSAFANTSGGIIVLGIKENMSTGAFVPTGVHNPQKMLSDLWNILNNPNKISSNILLDNHIYVSEYDGLSFIVIDVPRADRREKPVYVGSDPFKGTFRRNHEGDYHCKKEEVLAMMRDQSAESIDSKILDGAEMSDLNKESIYRYRTLFGNKKPGHAWTNLNDEEFLVKIGAAGRGSDKQIHPTLAGLIFFGDFIPITNELPNYFLDYRERLSTETRWSDRVTSGDATWSGNIFDFYFKIIDRLTADVKKPFKLDKDLLRVDDTPVHAGIRESLANALIHADYYGRCGIVIDKKFREITISNPGTFRISIDTAIAGGISDARNSRIFNMFSLIDVGERSGSGLCDIFHTWKENGYKKPSIVETLDPDRITFTLHITNDANLDVNDTNDANSDVNKTEIPAGLNTNELRILKLIKESPSISIEKIAKELQISRSTVDRGLRSLKKKNMVSREGRTRGRWIILK